MATSILVVDDERPFLADFREWAELSHVDFEVITADSGKRALTLLQSAHVDLVLTDLRMPEMDGYELLRIMRKHYSRIPVIIMTANGTPEMERRLRNSGAAEYLDKPLDLGTLMSTLRAVRSAANPV